MSFARDRIEASAERFRREGGASVAWWEGLDEEEALVVVHIGEERAARDEDFEAPADTWARGAADMTETTLVAESADMVGGEPGNGRRFIAGIAISWGLRQGRQVRIVRVVHGRIFSAMVRALQGHPNALVDGRGIIMISLRYMNKRIPITIDEQEYEQAHRAAEAQDLSFAALVRKLLREYVKKYFSKPLDKTISP